MDRGDFDQYLQALKAHDYAGFSKYYAEDFQAYMAGGVFDSNGAVAFERALAEMSEWTMDVCQVIADARGIAMEAVMDIRLKRDAPDFAAGPAKTGDRFKFHFAALYTLRANKIAQLRIFGLPIEKQAAG